MDASGGLFSTELNASLPLAEEEPHPSLLPEVKACSLFNAQEYKDKKSFISNYFRSDLPQLKKL